MKTSLLARVNAVVNSPEANPRVKAYSYLRFSTPEQMRGDSMRRQLEMARAYATAEGLELDENLTYQDLGVSGFRGANATEGQLGDFLKAVEIGVVPQGSVLLVENLDRLSRQTARRALRGLEEIVDAGVSVVTLMDRRRYDKEALDRDPYALIMAILTMTRAHEESATKQLRAREAWKAKVASARDARVSGLCPSWLRPATNGTHFEAIPERVEVVRRIFRMAAEGIGKDSIAKRLNLDGVPTFTTARQWYGSYVFRVLSNRAVLGELVANVREGSGDEVPTETHTVKGYYPAVITKKLFATVQTLSSASNNPQRGRHAAHSVGNILGGVAVCPRCGARMTRVNKTSGRKVWSTYLVCIRAKTGAQAEDGSRCQYRSVNYDVIERAIVENAEAIADEAPEPSGRGQGVQEQVRQLEAAELALSTALENLVETAERQPSASLAARIAKIEGELRETERTRQHAEEALREMAPSVVNHRLKELAKALRSDPLDKARANTLFRLLLSGAVIDYTQGEVVFRWRHGGETTLMFGFPS
jgi:DNA invertase Pin-like site-specific DNA recombinase